MPADFIKNPTEEKKTGLKGGTMLVPEFVPMLYSSNQIKENLQYILHTEPALSRQGLNGGFTSKLNWYDGHWVDDFLRHIFSIIDFLDIEPYAIEIHPGISQRRKNNFITFSKAINHLHEKYYQKYDNEIFIFIENRTGQIIEDGKSINRFWTVFKDKYPNLVNKTGIIVDIQQLYTVTKDNFENEFSKIHKNCLVGVHVHEKHRTPEMNHIPENCWKCISNELEFMSKSNRPFHVLPEVHHAKQVEETYLFCKNYLKF